MFNFAVVPTGLRQLSNYPVYPHKICRRAPCTNMTRLLAVKFNMRAQHTSQPLTSSWGEKTTEYIDINRHLMHHIQSEAGTQARYQTQSIPTLILVYTCRSIRPECHNAGRDAYNVVSIQRTGGQRIVLPLASVLLPSIDREQLIGRIEQVA